MPAAQTLTTSVKNANVATLTMLHAVVDEASKETNAAIKSCYRAELGSEYAPCDETTTITGLVEQGSTLPSFITWDSVNSPNDISVDPTDNAEAREYILEVTLDLVDNAALVYNQVTLTVEVCLITHFTIPTDPSPVTYSIHALSDTVVDLSSPGFVQQPACGYALNELFTWAITPVEHPAIFTDNNYVMTVSSTTNSDAGVYTLTLTNNIEYLDAAQNFAPLITFDITVIDPCLTTVIDALVLQYGPRDINGIY